MVTAIWDFLFTRRQWKVIQECRLNDEYGDAIGTRYVLQDQFGNIKKKDVR